MSETKTGPNDCHVTRRFSSKHLARVSFLLWCFEQILCGFSKLEYVISSDECKMKSVKHFLKLFAIILREKASADNAGEEFSTSIYSDDSEGRFIYLFIFLMIVCGVSVCFESYGQTILTTSLNVKNYLKPL